MDNKVICILFFPVGALMFLIFAARAIPLHHVLTEAERQIVEFSPEQQELGFLKNSKKQRVVSSGLKSPVSLVMPHFVNKAVKGKIEIKKNKRKKKVLSDSKDGVLIKNLRTQSISKAWLPTLHLSLVIVSDLHKMAIINDVVLLEGEFIEGIQIKKIEKKRVLLKGNESFWIELENRK